MRGHHAHPVDVPRVVNDPSAARTETLPGRHNAATGVPPEGVVATIDLAADTALFDLRELVKVNGVIERDAVVHRLREGFEGGAPRVICLLPCEVFFVGWHKEEDHSHAPIGGNTPGVIAG